MSDDDFRDRYESERAKNGTIQQTNDNLKEKIRRHLEIFGSREKADGSFEINYDKFVEMLGVDGALTVRKIIDERYQISGAPGEKPRITVKATAA